MTDEVVPGSDLATTDTDAQDVAILAQEFGHEMPAVVVPERFIPLRFVDVVMILPSTHPVVILEETDPPHRQLRIAIGSPEGIAIAYAAKGLHTPKPLTHELFVDTLAAFGVTIEVVRLTEVQKSSYLAEIIFSSASGQRTLRCRPSDAIALALRQGFGAPITASPGVLDQAGVPSVVN